MRHVTAMAGPGQAASDRTAKSGSRIAVDGLACVRGGRMLFAGLNLTLGPGGSAIVAGPNGVGKSSLLRTLCGLVAPYAGRIDAAGGFSLSDDHLALDADRRLVDALGFWSRIDGRGSGACHAAMTAMALDTLAEIPVRMLSTGQRKRASLARTLASGAGIWLLDEPANGLDRDSVSLLATAAEAHLAAGGIVIAASHMPLPWRQDEQIVLAAPLEEQAA